MKTTCPQVDPPKWLIYALGGGWGHLTRAVALAGASSTNIRILTNSPFASQVKSALPHLDLVILDHRAPIQTAREQAVAVIEATSPECLIVDTFPRGLGGELAGVLDACAGAKVLVHRDLNPSYVTESNLRDFVHDRYDLVLIPGASEGNAFPDHSNVVVTEPWLIRGLEDLPTPGRARQILRINDHRQRCILVCASGTAQELSWFGAVIAELLARDPGPAIRCVAPSCPPGCPIECWIKYWPAADLYPATDVVIGGAGYNTVHECAAYGMPLIAHPWPRLYDRQRLRAERSAVTIVDSPQEAAASAIRQLNAKHPERKTDFRNGTTEAIVRILRVTSSALLAGRLML